MRFRFCWDCDCPDWVLAEMLTLSKLNCDNLQGLVTIVVNSIVHDDLELTKAMALTSSNLDEIETKSSIAAIRWILESATTSDTDSTVLDSELQQLGLPKDHCSVIKDSFSISKSDIQLVLKKQSMKVSRKVKWKYDVLGLHLGQSKEPIVQLTFEGELSKLENNLNIKKRIADEQTIKIHVLPEQLDSLINELYIASKSMKELKATS